MTIIQLFLQIYFLHLQKVLLKILEIQKFHEEFKKGHEDRILQAEFSTGETIVDAVSSDSGEKPEF